MCKYCDTWKDPKYKTDKKDNDYPTIIGVKQFDLVYAKINYCPFCGKRLIN